MADVLKLASMVVADWRVDAVYHQHSEWTVPHLALPVLGAMLITFTCGSALLDSVTALRQLINNSGAPHGDSGRLYFRGPLQVLTQQDRKQIFGSVKVKERSLWPIANHCCKSNDSSIKEH
jgi:hypothetical protein